MTGRRLHHRRRTLADGSRVFLAVPSRCRPGGCRAQGRPDIAVASRLLARSRARPRGGEEVHLKRTVRYVLQSRTRMHLGPLQIPQSMS